VTNGLQRTPLKRPFNCPDAKESPMNKSVTILLATLGLILSQPALAQQDTSRVQTLRGADAAATDQAPAERSYRGSAPGSQKPVARTFSTQPPVIPHAIEGFDAVTLQDNPCLACHGPENYKNARAPKVADSHFKDRDGKMLSEVSAARHQCTSCHVPQADAKPLVENTFRGDAGAAAKKKK
jgi:nitrate reductase (cytochrome), electron transfer subunit